MATKLTLDINIKDIIQNNSNEEIYFLISNKEGLSDNSKVSIYDIIKIPNQTFSSDFQDLIKFIIPYGMKICGIIYLIDKSIDISKIKSVLTSIDSFLSSNQSVEYLFHNVMHCFGLLLLNNKVELKILEIINFETGIYFNTKISNVYFKDLSFILFRDYITFKIKDYDIILDMDKKYNLKHNDYLSNFDKRLTLQVKDLSIIIPNNNQLNLYDRYANNKIISNYFESNSEINLNLLIDSTQSAFDEIESENSLKVISGNDNTLKLIKVNLAYMINRDEFSFSFDFFQTVRKYFTSIINELIGLNYGTSYSYSLYQYQRTNGLLYYILYSKQDFCDHFEESLFSQRRFYMEIFSLDKINQTLIPLIKTTQLQGFNNDRYRNLKRELLDSQSKKYNELFSPHNDIFQDLSENLFLSMKGGYLFFHDKKNQLLSFLQTFISWMIFNGYISDDIPDKQAIIENMIYLGLRGIKDNENLRVEEVGYYLSYLFDMEIEILSFKNANEFYKNMDIILKHFKFFSCPVMMKVNNDKFFSIFAIDERCENIDLLYHGFNISYRDEHILYLKKKNLCYITKAKDLFIEDDKIILLISKPPNNI